MPRNRAGYDREYYLKNREHILKRVKEYTDTLKGIMVKEKKMANQNAKRRGAK